MEYQGFNKFEKIQPNSAFWKNKISLLFLQIDKNILEFNKYKFLNPRQISELKSQLQQLKDLKTFSKDWNSLQTFDQRINSIQILLTKPARDFQTRVNDINKSVLNDIQECTRILDYFEEKGQLNAYEIQKLSKDIKYIEEKFHLIFDDNRQQVKDFLARARPILLEAEFKEKQIQKAFRFPAFPVKLERNQNLQAQASLQKDLCVVCTNSEVTHIATPCYHFKFCETCSTKLIDCPICLKPCQAFMKVNQ